MTRIHSSIWLGLALHLGAPSLALAGNLAVPNTFAPATSIKSADMNANFTAVQNAVNTRPDVYGDGSAGPLNITANTNWVGTPPTSLNFQFTNITIAAGVTLTVPSGIVLKASGNFTNQGTLSVLAHGAQGAVLVDNGTTANRMPALRQPGAGAAARSAAGYGERVFGSGESAAGGFGAIGVSYLPTAAGILKPGPNGGGGGAGALNGASGTQNSAGTQGGGSLVILAAGTLTNAGTINADGDTTLGLGAGGGGGGIVILAAKTSVTNTGTINARGGNGSASGVSNGAGGGGGGGIVQLISVNAASTGVISVAPGAAGTLGGGGSVTGVSGRMGGGGGGGCGGHGGNGGGIGGNSPTAADPGNVGLSIIRTSTDPTSLF